MKNYICDNCGKTVPEAEVILKGITGISGGILVPERFHEKHFCIPKCFWEWIDKYQPREKDYRPTTSQINCQPE